ncbi:DASH complex subunit Dad1-domain-containing protein [Daldinia loculata]|nr:DASH complex subunit Dad1-domain-containing protein [Daldinia loculata]
MASNQQSLQRSTTPAGTREKTYFEQQREALIGEIAMVRILLTHIPHFPLLSAVAYFPTSFNHILLQSFEHVLANINKLNRSLEAVVAVGNEFSSVEALWSQFEGVMAKDPEEATPEGEGQGQHDRNENESGESAAARKS